MIAFKVVEKQTRHCTNWALFKKNYATSNKPFYTQTLKFKRRNSEWFPRYFKGYIVKAAPDSVGIFCFRTKTDAERFQNTYRGLRLNGLIIKVKGLSEPTIGTKIRIIPGCGTNNITNITFKHSNVLPPFGTLCFKSVEVLT